MHALCKREQSPSAVTEQVRQTARDLSYDRYLASLLAPKRFRPLLWALHAFAGEIASVPLRVSEPRLGEIRLQWWRDTVSGLAFSDPTGHPVAEALRPLLQQGPSMMNLLTGIVDARVFDLGGASMSDSHALATYCKKTEGAEFAIAAMILGASRSPQLDEAAGYAGVSYGVTRLLCTLPLQLSGGISHIPSEILENKRNSEADAFLYPTKSAMEEAIRKLTEMVRATHSKCAQILPNLSTEGRPAFLPMSLVPAYLQAATRRSRDPSRDIALINPLTRISRILLAHWRIL